MNEDRDYTQWYVEILDEILHLKDQDLDDKEVLKKSVYLLAREVHRQHKINGILYRDIKRVRSELRTCYEVARNYAKNRRKKRFWDYLFGEK